MERKIEFDWENVFSKKVGNIERSDKLFDFIRSAIENEIDWDPSKAYKIEIFESGWHKDE